MREQPHSEAYEKTAIALCLQYPDTTGAVLRSSLSSDAFYVAANRQLFEAIRDHHTEGEVAIVDAAMRNNAFVAAGGIKYYEYLKGTKVSERKRDEVIAKLSHYLCCRRMIEHGPEIIETAFTGNYEEASGKLSGLMDDLSRSVKHQDRGAGIKDCLNEVISEMMEMQASGKSICRPMGLTKLDNLTGGLLTEMILIGGPTSSGKSALSFEYALANCVQHKRPGIIFSYEMNRKTVTKRLLARLSGVSLSKLMGISPDGSPIKFRKDELIAVQRAVETLSESKLFIEDDVTATIEDVWDRSVEIKALHGDIGCVVIDYCQLVPPSHQTKKANREQQVSHQGLKAKQLSQHLDCSVLMLSQLAQDFTARESKALEQHAGNFYKVMRGEDTQTGRPIEDEHIYVWKNRAGPRFERVNIYFDGQTQKFTER